MSAVDSDLMPGQKRRRDEQIKGLLTEGKERYDVGLFKEAARTFAEAYEVDPANPHCLSWHGLMLILVEKKGAEGLRCCEEAVKGPGAEVPLLWINLARAYGVLRKREPMMRTLHRALDRFPEDTAVQQEIRRSDPRRRPVIGFLSRDNPVNKVLGKARHRLFRSK